MAWPNLNEKLALVPTDPGTSSMVSPFCISRVHLNHLQHPPFLTSLPLISSKGKPKKLKLKAEMVIKRRCGFGNVIPSLLLFMEFGLLLFSPFCTVTVYWQILRWVFGLVESFVIKWWLKNKCVGFGQLTWPFLGWHRLNGRNWLEKWCLSMLCCNCEMLFVLLVYALL